VRMQVCLPVRMQVCLSVRVRCPDLYTLADTKNINT
jgi:hypothetical protein